MTPGLSLFAVVPADDAVRPVGRFRSGHVQDGDAKALTDWRVTTGDPVGADKVFDLLGGDAPQEWAAKGEDKLEVFTASNEIEIIIPGPKSVRQRLVLWGRSGKPIYSTDGATKDDGTPDPDADLTFAERKQKGRDETGPTPDVDVYFKLVGEEELGIFQFKTGSWSIVQDFAYDGTIEKLAESDGPTRAVLKLEEVSFVAKNGPRKGQTVNYTKPVLKITGSASADVRTCS